MTIETPVEGVNAITDFLIDKPAEIADDIRDKLREIVKAGNSPVTASIHAIELIYARADELPTELLELGANLATMATQHNFHGMAESGRGPGIVKQFCNKHNVKVETAPASKSAPEPKPEYLAVPPDAENGPAGDSGAVPAG